DAGQPIGIVVRVRGSLAVLIGYRRPAPAIIVDERSSTCAPRISDGLQPVSGVIGERGLIIHRVGDGSTIAMGVVHVGRYVVLRILECVDQTGWPIRELGDVVQR